MKLFERIEIKLKRGISNQIRFFNFPIVQYDVIKKANKTHRKIYFPSANLKAQNTNKPIFYLKINLETQYAFLCLQYWLNIIDILNGDFYIICDKPHLEVEILRNITFRSGRIKFIKSIKKTLKGVVRNIAMPRWYNAAYAHLTTFYHAKSHNIDSFWNIDADDTMFVAPFEKSAEIMQKVMSYTNSSKEDIISLDMWHSRTKGQHWSFGVTYTRNINKFIDSFNASDKTWQEEYRVKDCALNIDWFITYLADKKIIEASTFYVENCYFIHWCRNSFIREIFLSYICYWKENMLNFPIISEVFENNKLGIIPISNDCKRIDVGLSRQECLKFLLNQVSNIQITPKITRKLWQISEI